MFLFVQKIYYHFLCIFVILEAMVYTHKPVYANYSSLTELSPVCLTPPLSDTVGRYVKEAKFGPMISDSKRFEVYYVTEKDVPTEDDLCVYLCRFTIAALNNREVFSDIITTPSPFLKGQFCLLMIEESENIHFHTYSILSHSVNSFRQMHSRGQTRAFHAY